MEYKVTDIITLLNAEYKGEVIESVSKLSSIIAKFRSFFIKIPCKIKKEDWK